MPSMMMLIQSPQQPAQPPPMTMFMPPSQPSTKDMEEQQRDAVREMY